MADTSYTSPPAAGSPVTTTITVRPTNNRAWTITQISVEMNSVTAGATCTVRKNGSFITNMVPNGDAADGTPVVLQPVDALTITWSGVTAGNVGKATILYEQGEVQP